MVAANGNPEEKDITPILPPPIPKREGWSGLAFGYLDYPMKSIG
jgi:hypothetical protein